MQNYQLYPDYNKNPKINQLINRCKKLGVPIFKYNGQPYNYRTLQNHCLERLTADPPRPIKKRGPRTVKGGLKLAHMIEPNEDPNFYEPGVKIDQWVVVVAKNGLHQWRRR